MIVFFISVIFLDAILAYFLINQTYAFAKAKALIGQAERSINGIRVFFTYVLEFIKFSSSKFYRMPFYW